MPWRPASGAVSVSQTWVGWNIYSIDILFSSCAPGRRRETPHAFFKHAERVDVVLDFGWRSAGAPSTPGFGRDGVERFTAAVTGLSSMPALASEVRLRRGRYFPRSLYNRDRPCDESSTGCAAPKSRSHRSWYSACWG